MTNSIPEAKNEIQGLMEQLQSSIFAIEAVSDLLNGCRDADTVQAGKLCYLLDPIVKQQQLICDSVNSILGY